MKRVFFSAFAALICSTAFTGCASLLLGAIGVPHVSASGIVNYNSSSDSDAANYDDPSARASQEAAQQMQGWLLEQQTQQIQDSVNQQAVQNSIDTANAAAANAAAVSAAINP